VQENEAILDAFTRLFEDYQDIAAKSARAGICCFTRKIPTQYALRFYPGARDGLVVEYDKTLLEEHFARKIGLGDCFKRVDYRKNPTLFESAAGVDMLWEESRNLNVYKGMMGILSNAKLTDELFVKMFTRIIKKYSYQKESRIILAGRNIPDDSADILGYAVKIPREAIVGIRVHRNCKKEIKEKLLTLGYPVKDMVK